MHFVTHLRTNCQPNAICFSHIYVVCSFCSCFFCFIPQNADEGKKNCRNTYLDQQSMHICWTCLVTSAPKMPRSSIGPGSQLLMVPCSLLVGDRWRGLHPVGGTLLGWRFCDNFIIAGIDTHTQHSWHRVIPSLLGTGR